jgi:hypothetical protein
MTRTLRIHAPGVAIRSGPRWRNVLARNQAEQEAQAQDCGSCAAWPEAHGPIQVSKDVGHASPYHKNHKHKARDYFGLKKYFSSKGHQRGPSKGEKSKAKRDQPAKDEDEDFQVANLTVNMIYGGPEQLEGKCKSKLME